MTTGAADTKMPRTPLLYPSGMPLEQRTRSIDTAVGGLTLSGLLAEPDGEPTALIVALHGHGMTAQYFAGPAHRNSSLLELGAALGFTVWAPDRLGYGASAGADPKSFGLFPQAEVLNTAIERLSERYPVGAGCFLLGHSFGLKLALTMAASPHRITLLGVDGSGSGLLYSFQPGVTRPDKHDGDLSPYWGPRDLYPPATLASDVMLASPSAAAPMQEAVDWPDDFRSFADRIRVPVRFTFADHERLWRVSEEHFAALRAALVSASRIEIQIQRGAGHNISLSKAARAYHLKALAFAEECVIDADRLRPPEANRTDPTTPPVISANDVRQGASTDPRVPRSRSSES